jgi:hypothetical protein
MPHTNCASLFPAARAKVRNERSDLPDDRETPRSRPVAAFASAQPKLPALEPS